MFGSARDSVGIGVLGGECEELTVMHTFADGLEYFDIEGSRAAVVSVILLFIFADNALGAFTCGKHTSGSGGDAWDNRASVEGQDRGVGVDAVGM